MSETLTQLLNWVNGWRYDLDGWLVRARKESDPIELSSEVGFVDEGCIAVRTPRQARQIDGGLWRAFEGSEP